MNGYQSVSEKLCERVSMSVSSPVKHLTAISLAGVSGQNNRFNPMAAQPVTAAPRYIRVDSRFRLSGRAAVTTLLEGIYGRGITSDWALTSLSHSPLCPGHQFQNDLSPGPLARTSPEHLERG